MIKTIIIKIKSLFSKQEEASHYQLKEDEDFIDDSEERLNEVAKQYDNEQKQLKKSKLDYRYYDIDFRPILAEYERQKSYKIRFEFIPTEQNFRNVRSALQYKYSSIQPWKEIRDYIESKSFVYVLNENGEKTKKFVCRICKCSSKDFKEDSTTDTQCHEVWSYNEKSKVQKLVKLKPVCFFCHEIIHINRFYKDTEYQNLLLERYAEINEISMEQARKDLEFANSEKKRRSKYRYTLDISLINKLDFGYEFSDYFDCHKQDFNSFIELKFKDNKDNDPE
ncbi:hypothetical protein [Burkholderia sp. 9779_493]|uniref:hypothetical protein n=1 Tax=Burkholderia sp. 9779_493 TaxID=2751184 RepID=UPI0018C40074|nr:hypothetical protein [Burkholderia sp. 9779_493]MBG0863709.1 hypothetical protein [Burkholderia sp. 9779_493]